MKDAGSKTYVTVKDNQNVLLHPSTVLQTEGEWLVYNEFVLTTKNFVRTVTTVKAEWLLDIAPNYYDLSTFSTGPVKSALERAVQKIRRKDAQKSQYSKR
ncbi:MAG: hypothetical protein Q9198_010042 [Flavoplaca austrocitrina]